MSVKIKFFLSDNEMAPTTISGKLFADAIKKAGYEVEIVQDTAKKKEILAYPNCDTIFFQKTIYPGHGYEDIKHLKGKVCLIHIDDDFLGMNQAAHINTLNISDLVLVANRKHAQLLKEYMGAPVEAIVHIPDFEHYPYTAFQDRKNNPLIICWQQNLADAYVDDLLMIKEPITSIHEKYKIELHLYGWHEGRHYNWPDKSLPIREAFPFARLFPYQPLTVYFNEYVPRIAKSDICIAPYINIPDRYGKSAFGLKSTMMLGVPVIASDFGVHQELILDGINGYLASTTEEWYEKLEKLILNPEVREEFSYRGRDIMEMEYSYENCSNRLLKALRKHLSIFK